MANVTYDGQSFSIDGRRIWLLGAGIEYARVAPESWARRIAAARQAGFNTIDTSCPWLLHEPRKGRFSFTGAADVRRFVELCGQAGMWMILRPGPYVGQGYDAGGLPAWLIETPGVRLREANEPFLERVSLYFRKLLAEVSDLQATGGGPILLVQSEHAWLCANPAQSDSYLREVTRIIRESGFSIPVINANDLWNDAAGTIDTWRGSEDLLAHLRQLRAVQADAPRLVSAFEAAPMETWGQPAPDPPDPREVFRRLAQVLAAGAQPVVSPFCGGTNFGFLGGRLAGRPDAFVTTAPEPAAPLNEAGAPGPSHGVMKRLLTFANHFGHVMADLDPDYHPVTLDVDGPVARQQLSIVPLRGPAGRIVFLFAGGPDRGKRRTTAAGDRQTTLVLEDGIRMPVDLGDQPVGWYLFDVDLMGSGRLDYTNLCPHALVDRSVLVLHGAPRTTGMLSIDGAPLEVTVPSGRSPQVTVHGQLTLVICGSPHVDSIFTDERKVYVGASAFGDDGEPIPAGTAPVWIIGAGGEVEKRGVTAAGGRSRTATITVSDWQAAPAAAHVKGESPRFASLDGPQTLAACGAAMGYGWYRMQLRIGSGGKRRWHLPEMADRAHLFVDGEPAHLAGLGRGADRQPFEMQLARGDRTVVALVDNMGRFADGNDLGELKGLYGHVQQVKRVTGARGQSADAAPVDPFSLRGYIAHRAKGQLSDTTQAAWTFTHARATPILVDVDGAACSGTFVLNDTPVAYYAGATGGTIGRYLLSRGTHESFKRGKNELRFAPDARQPGAVAEIIKHTTLMECAETPTESATWAFAKWEAPPVSAYGEVAKTAARSLRGVPCWWRATFETPEDATALRLSTVGLSKGQVFINGHNLGRYFTATADGRPVGAQDAMHVPAAWLDPSGPDEVVIFDEHGFAPHRVKLRARRRAGA